MAPQPKSSRQSLSWLDHVVLLVLLFMVALTVRTWWTYDQVFVAADAESDVGEGYVRFRGTDAWYQVRLVENLLAHFPQSIRFDPYLRHPGGATVEEAPLFDYLLALPAWLAGGGRPTTQLVETVAAWLPALLGALVTVPVYFLAHVLWGRPAGMIAGGLIAVLPGRFLERSLLGATDHHVAEVWWSTCCLLFLVLALDRRKRWLSVYPLAAGLSLAAYLLTWRSGSALPCLLLGWATVQLVSDLRQRRPIGGPAAVLLPTMAMALLATVPWLDGTRVPYRHAVVLTAGLLVAAGSAALARWQQRRQPSGRAMMLAAAGGAAVVVVLATIVFRAQLVELTELFRRLAPSDWSATVAEMRPLHLDDSVGRALWREFTTAMFAAGAGLALLVWRSWRRGRSAELLVLVWSLAMLAASLGQRRFTYYLAVSVALLSAAAVVWLLNFGFRHRGRELALTTVTAVLLLPNLRTATAQASRPSGPDRAWHTASSWLRAETPEPFGDESFYFASYATPDAASGPRQASYGVMAWWDRGFWLLRSARRAPVANPKGHGILTAASFYLEQDEAAALALLDKAGARYVVVDGEMPIRQAGGSEIGIGSMASMARWLGRPVERYVERYELRSGDGDWRPVFLYYPDYFRTMAVRLQTFAGAPVTPQGSLWVVGFREEHRPDGALIKRIGEMKPFSSYRRAVEYLDSRPVGYRLVSTDPASSCVPLPALETFRRAYPEEDGASTAVQVYEVTR